MNFDTERMCRLNGKKPTMRERWTAFYRLWRLTQGHGMNQDMDAADCLRILMPDWSWLLLVQETDIMGTRLPKFMRHRIVDVERRRRIEGRYGEFADVNKIVARKMHDTGTEVTPDEVAQTRIKVLRLVRDKALTDGVKIPEDDEDLLRWLAGPKGD